MLQNNKIINFQNEIIKELKKNVNLTRLIISIYYYFGFYTYFNELMSSQKNYTQKTNKYQPKNKKYLNKNNILKI
jgi:hypothetical protein